MKGKAVHRDVNGNWWRIVIVVISMYLILATNGALFLLAVSLKQLAADFDWPRSVPSAAYALLFIGSGLGGIVMGAWFDRSGPAPVTLLGATMLGTGAMLTSQITSAWQLYLIYGLMMGFLGQATVYGPLVLNIMRWFKHRRGFAVGLITAGQGLGGVVWPLVFRHFNETIGWRETFWWFGLLIWFTSVPMTFVLRRRPDVDTDLTKTSLDLPLSMTEPTSQVSRVSPRLIQMTLCLAMVGCCVSMSMPLAHLVSHASDLGHSTSRAAEMLSVALLTATVVRLVGGTVVVDRLGGLLALGLFSIAQTVGLALYAVVDGLGAMYLVSVLFGLGYGGINMCYPVIVQDKLPRNEVGRRLGVILLFGALGMALGGWLAGYIYDITGHYAAAFWVGVVFNLSNLVLIIFLARKTRVTCLSTGKLV